MAKVITQQFHDQLRHVVKEDMSKLFPVPSPGMDGEETPYEFCRFELKTSLTLGGSAEAYWCKATAASTWAAQTTIPTFTVYDLLGTKSGTGLDDATGGANGARGWAIKRPDWSGWEIVEMAGAAQGAAYGATDALTTSYAKATLGTLATGTSAGITLSSGGLKFAAAGTYMISGAASITWAASGTSQDIYATLYKNASPVTGTEMISACIVSQHGEVSIPPFPVVVAVDDIIYLYCKVGTSTGTIVAAILSAQRSG